MAYKKPQDPLTNNGFGIYPLTTADQVILSDGSRLEKNGVIAADMLGGIAAKDYALKANIVTSVDGKIGDVDSYSMLGARKVFGNTDPLIFIDSDGKIGGIHSGIPHYCYSELVPPPYPVTKVDGNTGVVDTFSFIEGSSFPISITKSGGLTCFSYPLQGSSSLSKGNTIVYKINFDRGAPIPVAASYIGSGYGLQCSICRNTNTSLLVSVTNNNDLAEFIDLTGAYICATFCPNGATSITGVSNA